MQVITIHYTRLRFSNPKEKLVALQLFVQCTVQAFTHAAGRRGLEVNFDKGKTKLLWNLIGKVAKAMKQELHATDNTIRWTSDQKVFAVHVCHQYKHLGTWVQTKHRHAREVSLRASSAK